MHNNTMIAECNENVCIEKKNMRDKIAMTIAIIANITLLALYFLAWYAKNSGNTHIKEIALLGAFACVLIGMMCTVISGGAKLLTFLIAQIINFVILFSIGAFLIGFGMISFDDWLKKINCIMLAALITIGFMFAPALVVFIMQNLADGVLEKLERLYI